MEKKSEVECVTAKRKDTDETVQAVAREKSHGGACGKQNRAIKPILHRSILSPVCSLL